MLPTFSPASLSALFAVLFLLALAPNLSVLIVTTRAATAGFRQGAAATLGIVVATLAYILVAVFGLMIVADMRPEARHVLRLIAAAYLVWNGIGRIQKAAKAPLASLPVTHRTAASFAMGFILTILNLRFLVFYVSLLPAFVDPGTMSLRKMLVVLGVAAASLGVAKLSYAAASVGGRVMPSVGVGKALNVIAGAVVAVTGFMLATGRFIRLD
jgi:threonine/homoserine/homoserine lactone efflux protein